VIVGDLGSAFGYDVLTTRSGKWWTASSPRAFREVVDGVRASGIEPTESDASIAEIPSLLGC
jgi:hypothetical protein